MDNRIMQRLTPIQILEERINILIKGLDYFDKVGEPKAMTIDAHNHFLDVLARTITEIPGTPDDTLGTKNRLRIKVKDLIYKYNDYRTEPVNTHYNMPVIPTVITDFLNTGGSRYFKSFRNKSRKLLHIKRNNRKKCSTRRK